MINQKKVIYNGQVLTLTRFWANNEPVLWINSVSQRNMPKMEFVGGYPDEYCIFIKKLTSQEKKLITDMNGRPFDLEKEIENIKL